MVDSAADRLGGLGVLVNNAGVFKPHPITETSYEEWQQAWQETLGVNLVGAANVSWCAAQHMIRGGGGSIVNVASRGAFRGEPKQPAYGASKAGLIALGQSLARALGPHGISVTSVAPGLVDTDMALENLAGDRGAQRRAESPLGRIATAEEVAAAVVFLASADAAMTSGAVLDINGASYLRL
jgi:NAD(P)-dependent dehydrogenase (short-subunit alcohol dehydrogenase family)